MKKQPRSTILIWVCSLLAAVFLCGAFLAASIFRDAPENRPLKGTCSLCGEENVEIVDRCPICHSFLCKYCAEEADQEYDGYYESGYSDGYSTGYDDGYIDAKWEQE